MKASISYRDLHDASQQAHKVAKKFDDYADELQSKVLNKLANYNGPWTSNMSNAYNSVSNKINELRTDYTRFETYSVDLDNLLDDCKEYDEAVKSRIAQLTGDFKKANGIRNSAIENFLAYTFTAIGNSTAAGRFLGNVNDYGRMVQDYLYQDIKVWYNFEGGKEWLKAIVVDALKIVGAVLAVVAAVVATVVTGGAFAIVALVAASVLLAIAIVDVAVDISHEALALEINKNPEDAAMAYRLREINSYSDFMRNGFILDEYDNTAFNQNYKGRRFAAISWDGLTLAAKIANFVGSLGSIITGGFSFDDSTIIGLIGGGYSFIGSLIEDGFQIHDVLNLDPTGLISGLWDIHSTGSDLLHKNFWDKPIELSLIKKLSSFSAYRPVSFKMPQIGLPTIIIPVIPGPHITGPHIPGPHIPGPHIPGPHIPGPHIPGPHIPGPHIPAPHIPVPIIPVPHIPVPHIPIVIVSF